ncbi:MAG: isoprenylcysteine carboxylmethyltransferase family protein [Clostridiales bacterium]|nr:isoprenylcysteine carboxylmethyltransferase family protein [Clostridiales bacterium]
MNTIDILAIISLVIFYTFMIGRILLLYKKGVKVWVIGDKSKKLLEKIIEISLVPVLIVWSAFVIIIALHIELPPIVSNYLINVLWLKYIGILFCYTGLIIFFFALVSFGRAWRIGIDEKNSNELITTGIFKYSRNPIFVFMGLYFSGITLIYPNIIFTVLTILTIAGIHVQILNEEQFLQKRFGEEYIKYKKQTRRYL